MGAIKCYGDFWSRTEVEWEPGVNGGKRQLLGRRLRDKTPVDFRYQRGVYVLFTPEREIVYVGQVGRGERAALYGRLRKHTRNRLRERWTHFSWFGIKAVENYELAEFVESLTDVKAVLNELEGVLIHLLEPRLNRQGPQWGGASEYLQLPKATSGAARAQDDEEPDDDPENDELIG